MINSPVIFRTN